MMFDRKKSMYKGDTKFNREQLIFVVEAIMTGAVDPMVDVAVKQKEDENNDSVIILEEPQDVEYAAGGMHGAGMALGVLCAQLAGEGLGVGDALNITKSDEFVRDYIENEMKKDGAPNMPPLHEQAVKFVDELFAEYLA